jgi:anhydro-N-acetylmuramic acid kinase
MTEHAAHKNRFAVGLISGTSMDGVDAALVEIRGPADRPRVKLRAFTTLAYPDWLRARLLDIASQNRTTAGEISTCNFKVGESFAIAAKKVLEAGNVPASEISVVGSHGQTIFHQSGASRPGNTFTLQIAEPAVIAEQTGVAVVADFRTADIAAGGEGAPLVPMVDYLLLRDAREGRVALNIGGIANVTGIPAGAKPNQVFGFDTGPGNMVMDSLVRGFTSEKEDYDTEGRIAATGHVILPILEEALSFPFFSRHPPKSAGREQFGAEFIEKYFLQRRRGRFQQLVRTALELTARTIADAIEKFVAPRAKVHRLIVSGGGAHNAVLIGRIAELLPKITVEKSDRYGLPVDAKEAIAFAILADRTMHGLPGNLPSVTGARRQVVLGKISRPNVRSVG